MKVKDAQSNMVSTTLVLFGMMLGMVCYSTFAQASEEKVREMLKTAKYVGTETCITCHDKEGREFKLSTHARISNDKNEGAAQGCEICHGPGSIHADASGGKDNIINPRKNPEICFTCHLDKKMEFRLPYHHPVLEGKMSCADCHNLHGDDVRPWSTTSMEDINEKCFKCHKDQRGPFVFEHQALREGCTTCHKVHGSIHEKMLIIRDQNLCLRCHAQQVADTMGTTQHADDWQRGTCWSGGCHTSVHGSNFDYHFKY